MANVRSLDDARAQLDREAATPQSFTDTDIANAQRFVRQHGSNVRFTPERGWFVWDGRKWTADEKAIRVQELAKQTALAIFDG